MKKSLIIAFLFAASFTVNGQQAAIIKWPEMQSILEKNNDTTYVINFWATWCVPCVQELPYFEKIAAENINKKLKLILISIDFRRQFESKLLPFLSKNKIRSEVYLLDEPDYNSWIDKVDPTWKGSIPATLIINGNKGIRKFYEREFTYEELNEIVKPIIL